MLNLCASREAKKAFAELIEAIAAALDLTTGQSQFLLTLSGAMLAFFVFYHLRRYVRAAPELPAEETLQAPGAPRPSRRRLYAVLGLVAGILCVTIGYTLGGFDSSLPVLGWLLIPASLLAMWIISLLDGRHKKDEAAESPTEAPQDPLETYAVISLVAAIFILILGLSSLKHAQKAERIRETAARIRDGREPPINTSDSFGFSPPPAYQLPKLSETIKTAWRGRLALPKLAKENPSTIPMVPKFIWPHRPKNFVEKTNWQNKKFVLEAFDLDGLDLPSGGTGESEGNNAPKPAGKNPTPKGSGN